jgi:penicillin G amidase
VSWDAHVLRAAFRLALGRRLPRTTGTLQVAGPRHSIRIARDRWGIPYIDAQTEEDAWFAVGFCHGQDRAFQLESTLRVVRGTLAEIVGAAGLPVDRLSRRIGFARAAEAQRAVLDAATASILDAYAAGVTQGATAGGTRKAHEFSILRTTPTPWTPADTIGILGLMSFALATNWDTELARLKILEEDGAEALRALDPAYPEWQPVNDPPGAPAGAVGDYLGSELAALAAVLPFGGGSNNWAIAPSKSASGRAIFANDPHLASSLPPHWYLVHVRTPEWSAGGATLAGAPGIIIGHNGFAAWGVTVAMTDNTDLFVEELGPDGRSVRQGDDFMPCPVRTERIRVKGAPDVLEEVLTTPRGPIVTPSFDGIDRALSMSAVWLRPLPVVGFLGAHRARSLDEFRRCMADWPALPLNVAYADERGEIALQVIGTAPRRRSGNGALPLPGWRVDAGWEPEMRPFDDLPFVRNPEAGLIVTANNKSREGDGAADLAVDWLDGYRAERIWELLRSRPRWDLASSAALQTDVRSVPWAGMRDAVLCASPTSPDAIRAHSILSAWDGELSADSIGATVFTLFVSDFSERIARRSAPRSWRHTLGAGFHPLAPGTSLGVRHVGRLERILRGEAPNPLERPLAEEIANSLGAVAARLRAERGASSRRWRWGHARPLRLLHPVGARKPLDRIFNLGPIPWGGDSNTVAQAMVPPLHPFANPGFIASLRFNVEAGDWDHARFVLPGGQSGNPLSLHYGDQFPLWRTGGHITMPHSPEAVAAIITEELYLSAIR